MARHAARDLVVSELSEQLPAGYRLLPYARNTTIDRLTVMVRLDGWAPNRDVTTSARTYRVGVIVLTPKLDTGTGDDELEAATEQVCAAIDATDRVDFTDVQRAVFEGENYPCFEITTTVYTT